MAPRWLRLALLVAALGVVALNAYEPHWRPDEGHYRFPVHLDEYWHWGMATAVQQTGDAEATDPFSNPVLGGDPNVAYPTLIHERGFHAYLAALQDATGLDWVVLFEFLPTVVALFGALVVYAIARRWDAGVEAVLWYAAVPTSLRFLGPGFLVPISLAIPLALAGFLVAMRADTRGGWIAVMLIAAGLWPLHAMGALLLTALVAAYAVASQARARGALLAVGTLLPLILAWPIYASGFEEPLRGTSLPTGLDSLRIVGPLFFVAAAVGAGWLLTRSDPEARAAGLTFTAALSVALALVLHRVTDDVDLFRLYDRTVTTMLPIAALLAGAGTAALVAALSILGARMRAPAPVLLVVALVVLAGQAVAVAGAIERNMDQPYYRPLTEARYEQYYAVRDDLPPGGYALVDGVDTMAWTAITGMPTAYVQTPEASLPPPEIQRFFSGGSNDTGFLVVRSVTVVVTDQPVANANLTAISRSVYVLRPEIVERMVGK